MKPRIVKNHHSVEQVQIPSTADWVQHCWRQVLPSQPGTPHRRCPVFSLPTLRTSQEKKFEISKAKSTARLTEAFVFLRWLQLSSKNLKWSEWTKMLRTRYGGGSKSWKKFLSSQVKHYICIHTESYACVCVCAFNHNGSNNKPIKNNFSWQKKIILEDEMNSKKCKF